MKKLILNSIILVALFSITIFSSHGQTIGELQKKIENMSKKMTEAMLNGEYEKTMAFYAEDAISLPSYQHMLIGIDAIQMANEAMGSSGVKIRTFDLSVKKIIMNDDLIVEIGTYSMSMEMPNSSQPFNDKEKYLNVWQKQEDGSLKIKADTWNSDHNPCMQGGM